MKNSISVFLLFTLIFVSTCYSKTQAPRHIYFAASQPDVIKIMTFNVKTAKTLGFAFGNWSSRRPLVFNVIQDHAPDVFGLQEPVRNQLEDFKGAFPQYDWYSAGGADGKDKGQQCPVFWRKDKFTLLDSGTFWFSESPDKPGTKSWGHIVPRFCSWVKLSEKGRSTCFYIYNTHLDSVSQNSREKSVRLLTKEISERNSSAPFIIMGDFNMKLVNSAMEFLMEESPENQFPVVDAWLAVHPDKPDTSTCNFGSWATGPQLDHIELGLNARPLEVQIDNRKVDGKYPSDHFPVIAKIELTSGTHVSKANSAHGQAPY
jgi:endonuclease/exonuclease/phosphatase family metal-dependent hydrolase